MKELLKYFSIIVICHFDLDLYAPHRRPLATQIDLLAENRPNEPTRWRVAGRHGSWMENRSAGGSWRSCPGLYQSTFSDVWI